MSYFPDADEAGANRANAVRASCRPAYDGIFAYLVFGLAFIFTAAIVLGVCP